MCVLCWGGNTNPGFNSAAQRPAVRHDPFVSTCVQFYCAYSAAQPPSIPVALHTELNLPGWRIFNSARFRTAPVLSSSTASAARHYQNHANRFLIVLDLLERFVLLPFPVSLFFCQGVIEKWKPRNFGGRELCFRTGQMASWFNRML